MGIFENLKNKKQQAAGMLENFNFSVFVRHNGEIVERIIDEHNLEYCFLPPIWRIMQDYQKMALMIKFSEKYSPSLPLTLNSFKIFDKDDEEEYETIFLDPETNEIVVDFHSKNLVNGDSTLIKLVGYEEFVKAEIFKYVMENTPHFSFNNIANLHQLRYLIENHEKMLVLANPDILLHPHNKEELDKACNFQSAETEITLRAMLKANDILYKANFFTHDFDAVVEKIKKDSFDLFHEFKNCAEKYFGDETKRDKALIYVVYQLEGLQDKGINFEQFEKHFLSLPKPNLNQELFPNITLSFERKDNLEK